MRWYKGADYDPPTVMSLPVTASHNGTRPEHIFEPWLPLLAHIVVIQRISVRLVQLVGL